MNNIYCDEQHLRDSSYRRNDKNGGKMIVTKISGFTTFKGFFAGACPVEERGLGMTKIKVTIKILCQKENTIFMFI